MGQGLLGQLGSTDHAWSGKKLHSNHVCFAGTRHKAGTAPCYLQNKIAVLSHLDVPTLYSQWLSPCRRLGYVGTRSHTQEGQLESKGLIHRRGSGVQPSICGAVNKQTRHAPALEDAWRLGGLQDRRPSRGLFFFVVCTTMLSYNSHIAQFTHLKCIYFSGFQHIHKVLHSSPPSILEHFHYPENKPCIP